MKYIKLTLLLLIASLNFNIILDKLNLVTGGTQGLTLVIKHFINIKPSMIILIINLITLILSYFLLSKETTKGTLVSSFMYPLCVKITSIINIEIPKNYLIFSIIAGIVCGITIALIYKLGFSSGGVSTINLLNNKYFNLNIALSNFIINTIIIITGVFINGIKLGLYSILVILISSITINIILKTKKV